MFLLTPLLCLGTLILFFVTAIYLTITLQDISKLDDINNPSLKTAKNYMVAASIIGSLVFPSLVVSTILLFLFYKENLKPYQAIVVYGFLVFSLIGSISITILSILAYVYIKRAETGPSSKALVAFILSIISSILILLTIVLRVFLSPRKIFKEGKEYPIPISTSETEFTLERGV